MKSSEVSSDARAEYTKRLEQLCAAQEHNMKLDARYSFARFAVMFGGAVFGAWLVLGKSHSLLWFAFPVAIFILLAVAHESVTRAIERGRRSTAFYERGLRRLNREWIGGGQSGEVYFNDKHPYTRDLDIFGNGSLFELLCTARTRAGETTLAAWLSAAAPQEEILARQSAIDELRMCVAFREDLAVLSDTLDAGVRPRALVKWAEGTSSIGPAYMRIVLAIMTALWFAGLAVWVALDSWYFAAAITVASAALASRLKSRAQDHIHEIEVALWDVRLLAKVLARIEKECFSSPKLKALQERLSKDGIVASARIQRLAKLAESLSSRRNLIVGMLDRFIFWSLQHALAIEAWRRANGRHVRDWLNALGEIEALSDLGNYAYEHPNDVFPEFASGGPVFRAEGLAHPLLDDAAVRNDIAFGPESRLLIVSGPNMAGKSTFARAVGVNAVLAQCGAPVRARTLTMSSLAVAASVCVLDSLQGGVSRFYAEITRLKLIMDMAQGSVPVLYLLDELLSGTNSHDRRAGAEAIVRSLYKRNAIGLVTTHDLALAAIATEIGPAAANVHFEDRIENGKLHFSYKIAPGVVQSSNALLLMRSIGLDV